MKKAMDLTNGAVGKTMIAYMLPFLFSNILQTLYSTADMIVVGNFVGSAGMVAVSTGGIIANLFALASIGFSAAGQIYIGQQTGAKNRDGVSQTIGTLVSLLFWISILCTAIVCLGNGLIVRWMKVRPEAVSEARNYIRIIALGFPFVYGYNAFCAALRGMGDSQSPFLFGAVSTLTNILLDLLMVGVLSMGAGGAAVATVISQTISCVFAVVYVNRRKKKFGLEFSVANLRIVWFHAGAIARLGIPLALRQFCIVLTQTYITATVNDLGLYPAAAYGVGDKLHTFSNTIDACFNQGGAAMVAQNLGANKIGRVKQMVRLSTIFMEAVALVLGGLLILFSRQFYGIFTSEPEVIAYAPAMCAANLVTMILAGAASSTQAVINGAGEGRLALIAGILDGVVFRLGFAWLFTEVFDFGVVGFFMASNFARTGPLLIGISYYFSGKWKTRRMIDTGTVSAEVNEE